jgi:hypothetical protein
MHLGDDERAIRLHDLQLQHAREAGTVNMIEHALTRGVVFRIATGAWSEAASAAQEALLLDRNLGLEELVAFPLRRSPSSRRCAATRPHPSTSASSTPSSSSVRHTEPSPGSCAASRTGRPRASPTPRLPRRCTTCSRSISPWCDG